MSSPRRSGPSDADLAAIAGRSVCYLTTRGRRTGRAHEIEIWFAVDGARLLLMAGSRDRADWIRNLAVDGAVTVRVDPVTWAGRARVVRPEEPADGLARRLLCGKYQGWREGQPLSEWGRTALPVVIEFGAVGPA